MLEKFESLNNMYPPPIRKLRAVGEVLNDPGRSFDEVLSARNASSIFPSLPVFTPIRPTAQRARTSS